MPNELKILLEERPETASFEYVRTKDGTRFYSHPEYSGLEFRVTYGSDGRGDNGHVNVQVLEAVTDEQSAALTTLLSSAFFEGPRFRSTVQTVPDVATGGVTWFRSVDGSSF